MNCSLCYRTETSYVNRKRVEYKPGEKVTSYICSCCVQKLLGMTQEQIKKALDEVTERGAHEKANLLEKFILEESTDGEQRSNIFKKRAHGNRPDRFIMPDKESDWRPAKEKGITLYQNQSKLKAVFRR